MNKLIPSLSVKPEVLSIVASIHCDKKRQVCQNIKISIYIKNTISNLLHFSLGNYGEIIIKTTDDYWITGKSSNEREFYVIIHQKNANLKDIAGMFLFLILCNKYMIS